MAACVLARVLRVRALVLVRVLRVLLRALVLVRELRHARVRALVRAACAACASTRAAFLVPPNSWQPRDTTTVRVLVRVRRT